MDLHDVAVPGTARHDPSKLSVSLAAVLKRVVPDRVVLDTVVHEQAVHEQVLEQALVDGHRVPALGES